MGSSRSIELHSTSFASSELAAHRREGRAEARRNARSKAELYAKAANVELGAPRHIEDIDPTSVRGRESRAHARAPGIDPGDGSQRPGAIAIGAAVAICFAIG